MRVWSCREDCAEQYCSVCCLVTALVSQLLATETSGTTSVAVFLSFENLGAIVEEPLSGSWFYEGLDAKGVLNEG